MNELFDKVSGDIKTAMLARDKVALEALRGIKKEFIEAKTAKGGDGNLADDAAVKILQKMVKQRKESAQIYSEQNRPVHISLSGGSTPKLLFKTLAQEPYKSQIQWQNLHLIMLMMIYH